MQDIVAEMLKVMEAKSLKPYSLIKDTPLSKSTLANLINRDVYPRLDTFCYLCEAMGESPCRFLCGFDCNKLSPKDMRCLQLFHRLDENEQDIILDTTENILTLLKK